MHPFFVFILFFLVFVFFGKTHVLVLQDENGNWQTGSIATMIDIIGSLAVHSVSPMFNVSVDFSMSFYSTAKFQEEVEIKAKVIGKKEKLTSVVVDIRKKNNGEIIATGKQWMSSTNINANRYQNSKL
ncbi:unnamed protein product [Lupinus luteus]|uniref:Thioesterase domain-containing protein n=1 Tax=Lupinus luteus TaxID=3873 RepID=A0AAV1YEC7_LUPLU